MATALRWTYRIPTRDIDLKLFWWQKIRSKLITALEHDDTLLAGFLASTSAAEILRTYSHLGDARHHRSKAPRSLGLQSCSHPRM